MTELHFPWLEAAILIPLIGAFCILRLNDPYLARKWSLVFNGFTFFCAVGAWQDFNFLHAAEAHDRWRLLSPLMTRELFVVDALSAPLLPLAALLYFLTTVSTLRTKIRRFSFAWTLVSEAILMATFSCKLPSGVIVLLAAGAVPPYLELRARGKPVRVFAMHMALFMALMAVGGVFLGSGGGPRAHSLWAVTPLLGAVLVRCGIAPFHCWMPELFEHATLGTAILFTTPLAGAYAAMRLVLPVAPEWVLHGIGLMSLITAVYAAGMALVQREARRFFCYLFLSHSALVLVGLEMVAPIGVTGALCLWLSIGLSLGGFGLTLRALESRVGRLSLTDFRGLYRHTPRLAVCFLLTGLASVGFPGTLGFVGTELLVDGAVETYPYVGISVVVAAALNSIAIMQVYFLLFTGKRHASSVSLMIRTRERFAVLTLAALILIGGLAPHAGVASRHHAAEELLRLRAATLGTPAGVYAHAPVK